MPEEEKKTVDLDTSGPGADIDIEETKDETVVDTETPKQETETVEQEATEQDDNKLEEYSKGVQARIAKLTRKMREAERREQAALDYARGVEESKKQLESKLKKQILIILKNLSQLFHQAWRQHKKNWLQPSKLVMQKLKLKLIKELQHSHLRLQD